MINEVTGLPQALVQKLTNNPQSEAAERSAQGATQKDKQFAPDQARELSLTDTAARLQRLEAQIATQPVVDTQRVDSVKKSISDGTFKIDARRVATKLAEFENLLTSKAADK